MRNVDNTEDILDSLDIIERIETLEALRDDTDNPELFDEAEKEELEILLELQEEGVDSCPDWEHGATLIRETYWVDYVQELLEDIGELPKDVPHYIVIDWDATANNIAMDYTRVNFGGVDYYIR